MLHAHALGGCQAAPAARRGGCAARLRSTARAPRPAAASGKSDGGAPLSEAALQDVVAKLAAAEAEAAKLRDALAAKDAVSLEGKSQEELARLRPAKLASGLRVDSQGARLGGVTPESGKASGWLSEEDVAFFTRGPGEAELGSSGVAPEEQGSVTRRLLLGGIATVGLVALALQPDTAGPPAKPLFFYLAPLLRIQALLQQAETVVSDADWTQLGALRRSILGSPNDARASLQSATAALRDPRAQERARSLASSFLEYVDQTDYAAYFDSRATPTGAQNAEFAAFSLRAVKAAEAQLADFLLLMPAEELEAARANAAASPFAASSG